MDIWNSACTIMGFQLNLAAGKETPPGDLRHVTVPATGTISQTPETIIQGRYRALLFSHVTFRHLSYAWYVGSAV